MPEHMNYQDFNVRDMDQASNAEDVLDEKKDKIDRFHSQNFKTKGIKAIDL